ncbi:MAG: glycoside hydrolase family 16 protein [Melioribacteraceae bacterium]|nr:glycoside hydrolase family 16 protein [Melioribacteraceae bacterium]
MKKLIILFFIFIYISAVSCSEDKDNPVTPDDKDTSKWKLVWADEFDYEGNPDPKKWGYDIGGHGWGNNELQYYTDREKNSVVKDGKLVITAEVENYENNFYTSARLVTKGKGDWTYGRFEIRAKLPSGKGTWPAIWMLPTVWSYGNGGWPDNGEIDIMEHVGYDQGKIHASIHCNNYVHSNGTQKTGTTIVTDCSEEFHNYIIEWNENEIRGLIDDKPYFRFINEGTGWEVWPFDKDFHIILNVAVGGNWGGLQGVDGYIFPQTMEVDYVRVYKAND